MAKVYPSKLDLFLASDALRQEVGGKVTIMGAFAGGQIQLAPNTPLPAHMPLAILAAFYDGEGDFETKLRIKNPSGEDTGELGTGRITKQPSQAMQIMVNFGIFGIQSLGKYRVDVILDDHIYTEYLTFSLSDKSFT
jgi:hypothetical protein